MAVQLHWSAIESAKLRLSQKRPCARMKQVPAHEQWRQDGLLRLCLHQRVPKSFFRQERAVASTIAHLAATACPTPPLTVRRAPTCLFTLAHGTCAVRFPHSIVIMLVSLSPSSRCAFVAPLPLHRKSAAVLATPTLISSPAKQNKSHTMLAIAAILLTMPLEPTTAINFSSTIT